MLKTFKYRLKPTKKQLCLLEATLTECCWLYNHLLEQRKNAWAQNKQYLSFQSQSASLPFLKVDRPALETVYAQVLTNVTARVDLAFKAFFRRLKAGEKPGYPRFKSESRYDSFTFPQNGFKVVDGKLSLSKIGRIRIKLHRPIEGAIKTCSIKRTATDKWFVSFSCEVTPNPLPASSEQIGIDLGLKSFATLSDGSKIANPRFFKKEEKVLAKAQRKFSKQEKGTPERAWTRKVVARVHERIANRRHNFCHQTARKLVNAFGLIVVEDLSIKDMQKNSFRSLNKSIGDAAWRMLLDLLSFKAAEAGREVVRVNPAYTSRTCSCCGSRRELKMSERVFECFCCGLTLDRDHNAALNILRLGTQSLGLALKAS